MPAPPQITNTFRIEVDGSPLADDVSQLLMTAVVDNNLSLPDMFVLTFRDPERVLLQKTGIQIGSKIAIYVVSESTPAGEKLMSGEVTALEAEYAPGGTQTVVRGFDHSHRLFRGRTTETYTDATTSDIATKVARRAGLEVGRIDPTTTVHKHVSQANVNDWQFLKALAREIDYEVAVVDGNLEFRAPPDASAAPDEGDLVSTNPLQLTLGANLLRFHAIVTSAEQVKETQVRGWDPAQKKALVGTASAATKSAALALGPADLASRFGNPTFVSVDTPFTTQMEVDAAAKATAEQIAGAFAEFDGVATGNPKLKAGSAVSLGLVGDPFDGSYTLTSTRHVYDPTDGYTTWFTVSGRQERSLLGLTSGATASGNGTGPAIHGVVSALVNDVRDPDGLGRVKLSFPWLADAYVSDWARVMQPGAGKDRGAVVLPEVNDEVLVAFDHGDIRRPYVVGGLYNGVDRPNTGDQLIDELTGEVRRRGFISKKAHGIVFFDADDKEGIALLTGDRSLRISMNKSKTTIKVTSSGKITIEGSGEVSVKAGSNLMIEAGASLQLKAKQVSINGDGPVEIKGTPIKLN